MTTYKVNLLINNIDVESDSYLAIIDPGPVSYTHLTLPTILLV